MCVAGLNVSTQSCNHRWYQLVRSCHPANNLANCPERLKLEGWEIRNNHCPFCDGEQAVPDTTHRLFGSMSSASSVASAPNSPDGISIPRSRRSGSSGTINTLSRQSSVSSGQLEMERGQMHREMNDRLLHYLMNDPHQVLPSAKKNYPTYPAAPIREEADPFELVHVNSGNGIISRGWSKGVRFGKNIFKT